MNPDPPPDPTSDNARDPGGTGPEQGRPAAGQAGDGAAGADPALRHGCLHSPPKPASRAERVSLWRYLRLFRKDLLSAQPARLYRAWMAEFRTPFFRSYLVNDPKLVRTVLNERPLDFPKSSRVAEGLRPLLGESVFLTNGETWLRQRRIIDPAFEGGRLRDAFAAMLAAGEATAERLQRRLPTALPGFGPGKGQAGDRSQDPASALPRCPIGPEPPPPGLTSPEAPLPEPTRPDRSALRAPIPGAATLVEIEEDCSHAAADVIFRTLFSIPITHSIASEVFHEFRAYQRSQPILNIGAFLRLPRWLPRFHRRSTRATAHSIRRLLTRLVEGRMAEIRAGTAPDDLATKIMTTRDPVTGQTFSPAEMVDQVAIFFLAGHETSASALGWSLWLLAANPAAQERAAAEALSLPEAPSFADLSKLRFTRDVFREALRLYPPVPMMVRETTRPETFRERAVPIGSQIVLSPWHLHRQERIWPQPDDFDPDRYASETGRACLRDAFIPFSAGARVCTGAGFAMIEGPLLLALMLRRLHFALVPDRIPVPVAYLTVRARDGIWLQVSARRTGSGA